MFNVYDLISERQKFDIGVRRPRSCEDSPLSKPNICGDELLAHVLEKNESEIAFITGSLFTNERVIKAIKEKYNIVGVYRIGRIFTNCGIQFYIVHLSKTQSTNLKFAFFRGKCYEKQTEIPNRHRLVVPDTYSKEWKQYVILLENWMNGGDIPESNKHYEFNYVENSLIVNDRLFPEYYPREYIEFRELLDRQNTKKLSEIAYILESSPLLNPYDDDIDDNETVKVLTPDNFKYPLDVSTLERNVPTTVPLRKGDIVFVPGGQPQAYLFNYDGEEQIYAIHSLVVLRCRKILPEYLCLYLNSKTILKIFDVRHLNILHGLPKGGVEDLPVIIPTQDDQKYISDFNILTNIGARTYDQAQKITDYDEHLHKIREKKEKPESIEDILNIEFADEIKAYREDQLRTFLRDDLKELNTCYRHKAYKAALILAGSILEAVLIDWISEIEGKNYFEEDLMVKDWKGDYQTANLCDYINRIKNLKKPRWAKEANKAHKIRLKRNLVHAKLCLDPNVIIDETICRTIIAYLGDVLKTRGVTTNQEE